MKPTISINIITFGIPEFLDKMLASLVKAKVPENVPVRVFEDKCPDINMADEMSSAYKKVCAKYGVEYFRTPMWGCCQGAAQYASMHSKEDWLILLGDDLLITPGCPASWIDRIHEYDASSAGLITVSWWDTSLMMADGFIKQAPDVLTDEFLSKELNNPRGIWGEKPGHLYVAVHGSGFMMRRKMWEEVGGFSQGTWVWDEDISFRCWMFSRYNIFTSPGPTAVHYMGLASSSFYKYKNFLQSPRNAAIQKTFGNGESWIKSWGYDKAITAPLCYIAIMDARRQSNGASAIDKCVLRDKPLSDKIKDWAAVSAKYNELGTWLLTNDIATLGM